MRTKPVNFYNDNDPENCAWLRSLIDAGHIPPGDVDQRSITEIQPDELTRYIQCHFFAGVGGWPLSLRLAGVPDDYPLWTASCPCQPFSQTGKRLGIADDRHLWPFLYRLIKAHRLIKVGHPAKLLGEQVASKDAELWLDGVFADLEALDFAVGAFDLPAASVGAPNIRQRFWWVADANGGERGGIADGEGCERNGPEARRVEGDGQPQLGGAVLGMAHTDQPTRDEGRAIDGRRDQGGDASARAGFGGGVVAGGLGDANDARSQGRDQQGDCGDQRALGAPSLGRWSAFEFVQCGDGKVRRIEPGSFPLAHGIPIRLGPLLTALRPMGRSAIKAARLNRVLRLHGYGNAINPFVGSEFIISCREAGILK